MNNKRRLTTLVLAIAMMVFGIEYAKAEKVEKTDLHYISSSGGLNNQGADKLFDGTYDKWCNTAPQLGATAYVIFSSEKIGKLKGYHITTGDDNVSYPGRNPKDWKIYGSNDDGVNKEWTLLHTVENDNVLLDVNYTTYNYDIENPVNGYFKYFKWEITKNKGAVAFQVGELALELEVCNHATLEEETTYEANCISGSYKGQLCSVCGHVVNKTYESQETNANNHVHKIKHDVLDATCIESGVATAYWECRDCGKYFSDEACTTEITDLSEYISIPTGHTFGADGKCTVCQTDKDPLMDLLNTNGVNFVSTEYNEYPWKESTKEGMTGIMSNNVGHIYTKSQMNIKLSCDQPFLLRFDYEVSSIRDKYTIYVDGVREVYEISGETSGEYSTILENGVHVISLTFAKENATDNFYDDRAYLYNFLATTDLSESPQKPRVVLSNDGTLTFYNKNIGFYYNQQKEGNSIYTIEDGEFPTWDDKKTDIKKVVFDDSFADQYPGRCQNWFSNCSNLTAIEGLRNLNTGRVRRFANMFSSCSQLTTLDITNFIVDGYDDIGEMFKDCSGLTTIYASDKFGDTNLWGNSVFTGCTSLVGAIQYDENKTGNEYANYKTGYFKTYVKIGDTQYDMCGENLNLDAEITVEDAEDLNINTAFTVKKLKYKRSFSNGNWKSLYVPFALNYSQWSNQGVEIAYPNTFHEYELEDGSHKMTMEVKRITSGSLLPNHPYLIRVTDGLQQEKTLEFDNVEVSRPESEQYECESVTRRYTFTGVYKPKSDFQNDENGIDYVLGIDKIGMPETGSTLKGQRWYLTISDRNGSDSEDTSIYAAAPRSIEIVDGDTTGIDEVNVGSANSDGHVYDLQGRKLNQQPAKGVYIKNGKKYIVK